MYQNYLADQKVRLLQEKVDADLARQAQEEDCPRCGAKLHRDNYDRKPRGGPAHWNKRHSLTCADHRHRLTPPSVRFLGRKVYVSTLVVLVSAMTHGVKPERVQRLRESLGIDRRTLEHWRRWWLETFAQSPFWRAARARFTPRLDEKTLPGSLCERFGVEQRDRLLDLLQFLSPISTGSGPWDGGN